MGVVDFTLVLSHAVEDRSVLTFALQLLAADGIAAITEPLYRSCDLARVAAAMVYPGPGTDILLAAGLELGQALFPELVAARFRQALAVARAQGTAVRLRLLGGAASQHLPWEYTILPPEQGEATPADFIALLPQVSLIREQEGVPRTGGSTSARTLRILGCVAAPPTAGAIDVARERQLLETALARANVALHWTERGRRPSAGGAADLFHFAGHGGFETERAGAGGAGATRDVTAPSAASDRASSGQGFLVFDDGAGGEDRVAAGDLAIVLRELGVRVAVLNTCEGATRDAQRWWSSVAAALLRGGVGSVVAMQHKILDASALAFATAFYRALAEGRSLDDAVRDGRVAVFERDGFGWGTPVLYLSADDSPASSAAPEDAPAPPAAPAVSRRTTAAPIALPGWTAAPRHLAWSMDGTRLAASDGKATCAVWERDARWQLVRHLSVAAVVHSCGWIDNRLVIARGDRLYLVESGEREIARVESPIRCALPLRSVVACVDTAGSAYLYEPGGRLRDRAPLGPEPWAEAATSPHDDSFTIATASGRLAVWGAGRRLVTASVPDGITALAYVAPDVVAAALATGILAVFAIENRRLLRLADQASVPVRPPIAIARGHVTMAPPVHDVVIHTLALRGPPRVAASVAAPAGDDVRCLAWSPDRTCLAVGTSSAVVFHAAN